MAHFLKTHLLVAAMQVEAMKVIPMGSKSQLWDVRVVERQIWFLLIFQKREASCIKHERGTWVGSLKCVWFMDREPGVCASCGNKLQWARIHRGHVPPVGRGMKIRRAQWGKVGGHVIGIGREVSVRPGSLMETSSLWSNSLFKSNTEKRNMPFCPQCTRHRRLLNWIVKGPLRPKNGINPSLSWRHREGERQAGMEIILWIK